MFIYRKLFEHLKNQTNSISPTLRIYIKLVDIKPCAQKSFNRNVNIC